MFKKTLIGVCGLVFVVALSLPAFADQSIGYRHYFNEGVKAFKDHDDQKAIRCFKIAQIYDPADKDLNRYLDILAQRGVVLYLPPPTVPPEKSIGYIYYLGKGIEAFQKQDYKKAKYYFNIAIIFYPDSKEADRYLKILGQPVVQAIAQPQLLPSVQLQQVEAIPQPSVPTTQVMPQSQPLPSAQSQQVEAIPQPPAVAPQGTIYIPAPKAKMPVPVIALAQITNNGQLNPKLQIEYHSSVIIQGKNIKRFLVVDEGPIGVKIIDTDHLEIDALAIGTTFLHIWDDFGRHTLYIEVIFPKYLTSSSLSANNGVQHSVPFTYTYSNDYTTYYSGKNIPDLQRQSFEFEQLVGIKGETPYGFFDTYGSYTDFDSFSDFDTYTIGLSQIPLEGTSNFNLRGFDALRSLSPLTMPQTRLRGAFADVDLMHDILGLSVSHGQEQEPQGFITTGGKQFLNSDIDAVKLTLFPKSNTDQYSFNYATAYGSDRPGYLTDHVYSVQGQHSFNDFLTLNAEEGSDSSHDATLASLRWQDGDFKSGFHFRNVDKNYSTISTLPSYQGETGVDWTTDMDLKNVQADSFIEAYRDRLDSNPNDNSAYNYDGNGHMRVDITPNLWSDSDFNFVDTPGELSPQQSLALNERLSRSFGIWNSMKGTVFGGVGYQGSHSSDSNISDYNREDVITGVQLPLTLHVSSFVNYEYDWLDQPDDGGYSYPSIINAGFEYRNQINQKLSFTSQVSYHDELGVKSDQNSFLSGEESVIISSGFNYNPTQDVNFFGDCDASKVLSHIGNPSYDDFALHVGVRITFGGATYWDPLGIVSGIVFKDMAGTGKFVRGDEGIAGVKVKVGDKEATTDKNGRYRIQVRAKGVDVFPILDTVPGGLLFSTPQTLNVEVFQGRTSHADFGLTSQTGIYGIVFLSKNGSNTPNEGDKFISKVRVILDGNIIQRSDISGAFYFRKVSPGRHIISIDLNSLALNMVPLVKLKNQVDVAEGTNYMFNIPLKIEKAESEEK